MKLKSFLGLSAAYTLEQRIQVMASSVAILVTAIAMVLGIFLEQETPLIIFGFICLAIMALVNVYSRRQNNGIALFALIGIILVIIPVAWFYNEGSKGPVPVLFLFSAAITMVIVPTRVRWPIAIIMMAMLILLLLVDAFRPQWIVPYNSEEDRLLDVSILVGLVSFPGIFLITGYVVESYRQARDNEQKERSLSENLLHAILPDRVARTLRSGQSFAPEHHESVSILFTDLVDFSRIAENLEPELLISELDDLFSNYDRIAVEHGVQRIKTIGDAYMAVCGAPEEDPEHASKVVACALDMLDWLVQRNSRSKLQWMMRCGIHSGAIVAGVVGSHRYAYDIWGDAVNVASRMESSGIAMAVSVSASTKELAPGFQYKSRGLVEIKNKEPVEVFVANR